MDGLILNILISAPVNCKWSEWKIGQCSKSCDGGLRNKTRTIRTKESNKGKCEGNATFQETCSLNNCSSQYIFKIYFFIGKYNSFHMKLNTISDTQFSTSAAERY